MANQCVACTAHSDCQSQLCDTYGDIVGVGKCVPASNIIYVHSNEDNPLACAATDGTQGSPFCDVDGALAKLAQMKTATPRPVIRLLASPDSYIIPAIDMSMGTVTIYGSGLSTAGNATSLRPDTMDDLFQIGSGATVLIDGVQLVAQGMTSLTGSQVTLRRCEANYETFQSLFMGTVSLDRDLFSESTVSLKFQNANVSVTNSYFTGNTSDAINTLLSFDGGTASFQFNTVAYNTAPADAMVLNCLNSANVTVKNSIFVQNGVTQQIGSTCRTIANSLIVGKDDSANGQIKQDPSFVDPSLFDLRLKQRDPINTQYVVDKAVEVNAADKYVDHDYFGSPRPQGAGYDIGAVEEQP